MYKKCTSKIREFIMGHYLFFFIKICDLVNFASGNMIIKMKVILSFRPDRFLKTIAQCLSTYWLVCTSINKLTDRECINIHQESKILRGSSNPTMTMSFSSWDFKILLSVEYIIWPIVSLIFIEVTSWGTYWYVVKYLL